VGDLIPDAHSPNPVELSEKRELLRALVAALPHLPERERLILSLYYNEELTMKEISRVLEVSESRVCQLHAQALARLRRQLQDRRPR
jgi:RNA polymerase sigma factor for flagellar operon FliA